MYGQTEMPLTGLVSDINRTIHPDHQERVGAALALAIEARGTLEVEFPVVHPDGSERTIYARGQALVDASGTVVRVIGTNADVTDMRHDQRQAIEDAQRMAGLVAVAQELGDASTEAEVLQVVNRAATALLHADAAALCLLVGGSREAGLVRTLTHDLDAEFSAAVAELPLDFPLPAVETVTSGASWFVQRRTDAAQDFAAGMPVWEASGVDAVAVVPLTSSAGVVGSLSITYTGQHVWREADQQLVRTFAALTSQALVRLAARQAEAVALHAAQRSAAQQAALVSLASSLDLAADEQEVLAVVTGGGVGLLGAKGVVLCLRTDDGVRALTTQFFDEQVQAEVAELPAGFPLPMVDAAVHDRSHYCTDRDAAVSLFDRGEEETRPLYEQARTEGSAAVPLSTGGACVGSLSLAFSGPRSWSQAERQLLEAFAALTAQALERIRAREAEEAANAAVRRFSETLQRSLLTSPPEPNHLHIAVRYLPAAAEAQVGGDWYDAFMSGDGATSLVVGDVTGHDRDAAAAMGQMRNLLRGIAHVTGAVPSSVLASLDAAVHDLAVGAMATVVLARLEQTEAHRERGFRTVRWSNAGHPPPLLLHADGTTEFLEHESDLLIGIDPSLPRHDHEGRLEPGSTLLIYTDGLIERRGAPLQQGLDWLAGAVADARHLDPEALCDELLRQVGDQVDDDVAMVVVRAYPEDEPRPASAGPEVSPVDEPPAVSAR